MFPWASIWCSIVRAPSIVVNYFNYLSNHSCFNWVSSFFSGWSTWPDFARHRIQPAKSYRNCIFWYQIYRRWKPDRKYIENQEHKFYFSSLYVDYIYSNGWILSPGSPDSWKLNHILLNFILVLSSMLRMPVN